MCLYKFDHNLPIGSGDSVQTKSYADADADRILTHVHIINYHIENLRTATFHHLLWGLTSVTSLLKTSIKKLYNPFETDKWSIRQGKPIWNVKLWTNDQNGVKLTFKKHTDNFKIDQ